MPDIQAVNCNKVMIKVLVLKLGLFKIIKKNIVEVIPSALTKSKYIAFHIILIAEILC